MTPPPEETAKSTVIILCALVVIGAMLIASPLIIFGLRDRYRPFPRAIARYALYALVGGIAAYYVRPYAHATRHFDMGIRGIIHLFAPLFVLFSCLADKDEPFGKNGLDGAGGAHKAHDTKA